MRQFYFLLTFSLFFFSKSSYAQLTNGTKSLGGHANVSGYYSTYKNVQTPVSTNLSRSIGFYFAPSYAVFKNNFLFGATVGNGLSGNKSLIENVTNTQKWAYINYSFSLNPYVHYYFKNDSKRAYFAFGDVAYSGTLTNRKLQIGNTSIYAYNEDRFTWRAGFGAHKVINKNFVVQGVLYYESSGNIAFSAGLRHFYTYFDKKNQEAPPQYIAKNRWQISGSFYANNNYKDKSNYIGFNVMGGKMLDNHFMVGSSVNLGFSGFSHTLYSTFDLSPFVRYYIPLSNRFFAYPYIGSTVNLSAKNQASINFSRGIGFQYFMTQNLALTCTTNGYFSHSKNDLTSRTSANGALNLGFSYFVK
jgi:hypothetical protein